MFAGKARSHAVQYTLDREQDGIVMLTYRVRKRVLRAHDPSRLVFPSIVEVCVELTPNQPFGTDPAGGRTAVRAVAATALFNASTGQHTIESKQPLKPLDVTIEEPDRLIQLAGNILTITCPFESAQELNGFLESIYYGLPILLNVEYADPPLIGQVTGRVGEAEFKWELDGWRMAFSTTTQDRQEQAFARAWDRFNLLSAPHRRRLIAALHYFHVACRLDRVAKVPGEFMAEMILNLAKILEVLFPPIGDGNNRDAARAGLKQLGYGAEAVERDYIPAMALRNVIDVGHVYLSMFTFPQLRVIHAYTERAETAFRDLLKRVVERIESGTFDVPEYTDPTPGRDAIAIVETMAARMADDA